jgi:hypothetical protein
MKIHSPMALAPHMETKRIATRPPKLLPLEPVDKVQVKGMDEVGVVIAFQLAL